MSTNDPLVIVFHKIFPVISPVGDTIKPEFNTICTNLQNFEKPPLYRSRYSTNFPPGCLTVAKNLNEKLCSHIPIGQSIFIFKIVSKPTHFGYDILSISIEFGSIEKVIAMIKEYQRSLM